MELIYILHSHMRHLVLLFGALSVVCCIWALVKRTGFNTLFVWVVRLYSIALTIQFLLGAVNLVTLWTSEGAILRYRLEHAFIMFLALGVAHTTPRFMRKVGGEFPTFALVLGSLLLIVLGIWILPQGAIILGLAR
jgi:hypothetical protein